MPGQDKDWKDLCHAALEAQDPDEMLKILLELDRVLKRDEEMRRALRQSIPLKSDLAKQC